MRRSVGVPLPHDRESNLTVNVLLRQLEAFNGIVIFATNLAANFDPAFERRIRTHVLFEMPGVGRAGAHLGTARLVRKRPRWPPTWISGGLAERYQVSGGDIKNAVIKAAAAAAAEPGLDQDKLIGQHHFERATEEVLAAKTIMRQCALCREWRCGAQCSFTCCKTWKRGGASP